MSSDSELLARIDERTANLVETHKETKEELKELKEEVHALALSRARVVGIKDFVVVCLSLTGAAAIALKHKVIGG